MHPLRPARGPTAAPSCQAIRLVNIPQINSGSIIKPHCYLIPQRLGRLLYQDCKLQRAMSVFSFLILDDPSFTSLVGTDAQERWIFWERIKSLL